MRRRIAFALAGGFAGVAVARALQALGVPSMLSSAPLIAAGMLALWYGERTGRVPTVDEVHRPISLFGEHHRP